MYYIRPIEQNDFNTLKEIAIESGPGFTSLPENDELLQAKIDHSRVAFTSADGSGSQSYLFVLVDSSTQQVVGTTGIESAVGLKEPWYHYRIGTVVHASRELKVHNQFRTLYLCNDYTGCSEVCTLYLKPEHRKESNGGLLSKSRFLFMAQHRERFSAKVIAEMRGYSDENGFSPFWEGLGRHFFSMEYSEADYLTGSGNKVFIAELMPKHSIYIHLLPKSAQEVIGRVHKQTEPARNMLEREGFRYENYVDIFDAGPTIAAPLNKIRAVRESHQLKVTISNDTASTGSSSYLLSNTRLQDFRALLGEIELHGDHAVISRESADLLQVNEGDEIRCVKMKGGRS